MEKQETGEAKIKELAATIALLTYLLHLRLSSIGGVISSGDWLKAVEKYFELAASAVYKKDPDAIKIVEAAVAELASIQKAATRDGGGEVEH